ncbi:hypothetical protein QOZ96_003589 [Brevundimonas nasdae]|uniref:hypothetical protein n=1 Tax=Brevundimonas nasdae TaxID=172043 RepID=UPI0019117179|nr:hypothetical protein [Brevundimonas nasdae]MBK6024529.1 hypothetical protein [Brevundimonas nasdae]MDQ0453616.1 hypothetical protein [Brevundimonas nasdae]
MHKPAAPTRAFLVNKGLTAGDQVRVNIRTLANSAAIKREKRNGRDVIIVPSATLPDDVVMNDILYPAAEIAKSFKTLERTPAPLGHPAINGKFLSARDPEGINGHYIGAWNENVRQEGGRVLLDKVIDIEFANQSAGGKRVLAAIDAGDAVHTSTGLLAIMDAANGDVPYKFTARDIEFDHDAILLDEDGAATPEQGVGMMVNSAGQEIQVVNSVIEDDADRELGWAFDQALRAVEKRQRASLFDKFKSVIEATFGTEREPSNNQKDDEMDKVQFDELSAKVNAITDALKPEALDARLGTIIDAKIKPITDQMIANAADQKAKDEAEHTDLVGKVVKANLLDEETAKELTLNALRKLAPKAEPGKAAPIANSGFRPSGDTKPSFKLPAADKKEG